jgi:hypothetical protein
MPLPVPDVLPLAPEALPLEAHEVQGGGGLGLPQPTSGAHAKAARMRSSLAWILGNCGMRPRNFSERIGKASGLTQVACPRVDHVNAEGFRADPIAPLRHWLIALSRSGPSEARLDLAVAQAQRDDLGST